MEVRKHPHKMRRYSRVVDGPISDFGIDETGKTVEFSVQGETHVFEFAMHRKEWETLVKTIEEMRSGTPVDDSKEEAVMVPKRPLKLIVKWDYDEHRPTLRGGGSVLLTLECGHKIRCRYSKEPKRRARCPQCLYVEED